MGLEQIRVQNLPWLAAAGLLNRCAWGAAALRPGDVAVLKTAPAFVDSVAELFAPLLAGVPLVTAVPTPSQQCLHIDVLHPLLQCSELCIPCMSVYVFTALRC